MNYIKKPSSQYSDMFVKLYPELCNPKDNYGMTNNMPVKDVTLVVTQDCNLRCKYCYEHDKNCNNIMSKDTAKEIIDRLFEESVIEDGYISPKKSQAIVLNFIGGEPLLEIDLIDYTVDYFKYKAITLNHRWAKFYIIAISTNGILYNTEKVQNFIKKNEFKLSISITIDGNKELHDSCRVFPDGSGSYDIVEKAYKEYLKTSSHKVTKLTLSPDNVKYLYGAVMHLYDLGLDDVFANCVYEKGWTISHAKVLYEEMKKLADYLLEDENYTKKSCTLFDDSIGHSMNAVTENKNWCGGTGCMLAIDAKGDIYPCLRYLPFSLKPECKSLIIGTVKDGIAVTQEQKDIIAELDCITRRSQSTDECFNCSITSGCAWCSAYNYEENGTANKRVTYICIMHKARVLANIYYWNSLYCKLKTNKQFPMNIPKEWALEIIDENEYEMLQNIKN